MVELQTYFLSILVLFVIYFSFNKQRKTLESRHRYFFSLLGLNIFILGIEIVRTLTQGYTTGWVYQVSIWTNVIYFVTLTTIVSIWCLYVNFHVNEHKKHFKIIMTTLSVFVLLSAVLALFSPWYQWLFYIDDTGLYQRGIFYNFVLYTSYFIMLLSLIYIIIHKSVIPKTDFFALLFFTIPPMFVAGVQIFIPELKLLWPSMTISVLILYIYIQSKITNTDPLTGLFNRREFDKQMIYLSNLKVFKKQICAIMIDIDDFKLINDVISHQMGDLALRELAEILKKSVRKDDFVARIGGDEFCVIIESETESILFDIVNRIEYLVQANNKRRKDYFTLSLSMGYGVYNAKYFSSFEEFFEKLDRKMYKDKTETKQKNQFNA